MQPATFGKGTFYFSNVFLACYNQLNCLNHDKQKLHLQIINCNIVTDFFLFLLWNSCQLNSHLNIFFKGKRYADLSVMIIIIRLIQSYFWPTIILFLIIQWNVRNRWNVVIITSVYYTTIFYFLSYRKKLETATLWQFCLHWLKQQIFTIIWVNSNSVITLKNKMLYSFILFL